jgi:hypothetical protein
MTPTELCQLASTWPGTMPASGCAIEGGIRSRPNPIRATKRAGKALSRRSCPDHANPLEDSMATKPLPDQALLLKLLRYEPETGKLYWRERTPEMFAGAERTNTHQANVWNSSNAGQEAFTARTQGYLHGTIFGSKVRAHRVIWKMDRGTDPEFIDHIDGDRANNRLANLRSVSRQINAMNSALRNDNKIGIPGITYDEQYGSWRARIAKEGRIILLGSYRTKTEAVAARKAAEGRLGFHPNHGRVR